MHLELLENIVKNSNLFTGLFSSPPDGHASLRSMKHHFVMAMVNSHLQLPIVPLWIHMSNIWPHVLSHGYLAGQPASCW